MWCLKSCYVNSIGGLLVEALSHDVWNDSLRYDVLLIINPSTVYGFSGIISLRQGAFSG